MLFFSHSNKIKKKTCLLLGYYNNKIYVKCTSYFFFVVAHSNLILKDHLVFYRSSMFCFFWCAFHAFAWFHNFHKTLSFLLWLCDLPWLLLTAFSRFSVFSPSFSFQFLLTSPTAYRGIASPVRQTRPALHCMHIAHAHHPLVSLRKHNQMQFSSPTQSILKHSSI
jgi:hypothetical protein